VVPFGGPDEHGTVRKKIDGRRSIDVPMGDA